MAEFTGQWQIKLASCVFLANQPNEKITFIFVGMFQLPVFQSIFLSLLRR